MSINLDQAYYEPRFVCSDKSITSPGVADIIPKRAWGIVCRTQNVTTNLPLFGGIAIVRATKTINDVPLATLPAKIGGIISIADIIEITLPLRALPFSAVCFDQPVQITVDWFMCKESVRKAIIQAPILYCDEYCWNVDTDFAICNVFKS